MLVEAHRTRKASSALASHDQMRQLLGGSGSQRRCHKEATAAIHLTTESGSFWEDVAFLVFVLLSGLYIIKRGDLPRGDKHKTSRWWEVLFFPSADRLMTSSP
ncbi:hypothetical protein ABE67_24470 [Cytobacillus firmus]|nr:hypothetical protein [Cytobacillus firmus]